MAYNQNGQGYQGQYPYPQASFSPPNRYGGFAPAPPAQQQPVRRTPSFDTGDDRTVSGFVNQDQEAYAANSAYRPGIGPPQGELFLATQSPDLRHHSSGSSPSTVYPPYGSPSVSLNPNTHSAYNPQEYARPPPQPALQAYNSPVGQNPGYHPYVPAAYSVTNPAQQPAYPYQPPQPSPGLYGSALPSQTSINNYPLPTLPHEQPYGQRFNQPPAQQPPIQPTMNSYRHAPLPQLPSSSPQTQRHPAYTPPAPPPPPFSPSHDAFPSDPPSTAPGRTYTLNSSASISPDSRSGLQRLPSLPHYPGSTDYTSLSLSPRQSASPRSSPIITLPSTPGPPPPQHSPQRANTTGRHPQQRPLPGPPRVFSEDANYFDQRNGGNHDANEEPYGYDDIMKEVEAAVMGRAPSSARPSPRLERINHQIPINEEEEPRPLFSGIPQGTIAPDTNHTHTNGLGSIGSGIDINYGAYSDDSDAEAAAGLAAMQLAEEQEAADAARRYSGQTTVQSMYGSPQNSRHGVQQTEHSSDSDVPVDIETYASSFPAQLHYQYGNESSGDSRSRDSSNVQYQHSVGGSTRRSNLSSEVLEMPDDSYFINNEDSIHPFPSFGARVDTGGTGGLAEPSSHPRRLSFEDGDETPFLDTEYGDTSGAPSPARDPLPPRPTSHPSRAASRPLPHLPGLMTSGYRPRLGFDQYGRPAYPLRPDEYEQAYTPAGTPVQKSNSIGSHSSTPVVVPPGRSITDAEQRRRQQQLSGHRSSVGYDPSSGTDTSATSGGKPGDLDLPAIPAGRRKKFVPSKLSSHDFKRCSEPWALSSVLLWVKEMTEGEADLKEQAIIDAIVALFTHKVPTMNTADAEVLSAQVVYGMFAAGALMKEEEWVKLGPNEVSGVLFQLTGTGCYSPRVHTTTMQGRCYAHLCMRTLKKLNLQAQSKPEKQEWLPFYELKMEDIEHVPKKEIERQNVLHEIVVSEDAYMEQLRVLTDLYRAGLTSTQQAIIPPKKLDSFVKGVFGNVDAVKKANEDFLLAQLKYRQQEKGPWIPGFSDIFREWIRKAKAAYIEYAANFPNATLLVRRESERNVLFRQYLEQMRTAESSDRLGWDTYLKAPITRLQRYGLLLSTVLKATTQEGPEKTNLQIAYDEVKAVTLECDVRVAEMSKRVDLADLSNKLKLRPGMEKVQLNLMHLGREVIFQGDLQRKGTNKVSWLDIHAILFDHYLVLAKSIQQRDAAGGLKHEVYDVSKLVSSHSFKSSCNGKIAHYVHSRFQWIYWSSKAQMTSQLSNHLSEALLQCQL